MNVVLRASLATIWFVVRWPVFATLVILEPIARVILSGVALISVVIAVFFSLFATIPSFPFYGMLAVAVACLLGLVTYYILIGIFSG